MNEKLIKIFKSKKYLTRKIPRMKRHVEWLLELSYLNSMMCSSNAYHPKGPSYIVDKLIQLRGRFDWRISYQWWFHCFPLDTPNLARDYYTYQYSKCYHKFPISILERMICKNSKKSKRLLRNSRLQSW